MQLERFLSLLGEFRLINLKQSEIRGGRPEGVKYDCQSSNFTSISTIMDRKSEVLPPYYEEIYNFLIFLNQSEP